MHKKRIGYKLIIVVGIAFLLISNLSLSYANMETTVLHVSVCYDEYFNGAIEQYGLLDFLKRNEGLTLEISVNERFIWSDDIDVYIVSTTNHDLRALINDPRFCDLKPLVNNEIMEQLVIPSWAFSNNHELTALPLFLGTYVLEFNRSYFNKLFSNYPSPDVCKTTTFLDIVSWANEIKLIDDGSLHLIKGILVIANQLNLMAYNIDNNTIDYNSPLIRNYIAILKETYEKKWLLINSPLDIDDILISGDELFSYNFISLLQDNDKEICFPYTKTDYEYLPTAARVAMISSKSSQKQLGMKFIESFISLEAQMKLPTCGIVRRDIKSIIANEFAQATEWSKHMNNVWGTPLSVEDFDKYFDLIEHSSLVLGTLEESINSANILLQYLQDNITLDEVIIQLEDNLKQNQNSSKIKQEYFQPNKQIANDTQQ